MKKVIIITATLFCSAISLQVWSAPAQKPALTEKEDGETAILNVRGTFMKAFLVTYADFMKIKDLPKSKKLIENYKVGFSEDKQNYYIFFYPKVDTRKNKVQIIGGETEFGVEMRYTIRKKDYVIQQRAYYR